MSSRQLVQAARTDPPPPCSQRFAYACAALLVLSGLFHVGAFLADGPGEGPLPWRKPITFGLSFGVTVATLAWVLGFLRPRRAVAWVLVVVLAVASVGEVALISLQTWRGVPSHFNDSTPFDETVFSLMGLLVTAVAGHGRPHAPGVRSLRAAPRPAWRSPSAPGWC